MATRRSLTTTTAAAVAVLFALCFMPTAAASPAPATAAAPAASAAPSTGAPAAAPGTAARAQAPAGLADTGAVDTTPYLVGGAGFLAAGAAMLLAVRRRVLLRGEGGPEAGAAPAV